MVEDVHPLLGVVVYPAAPSASLTTIIFKYLFPGHVPLYTSFPEIIAEIWFWPFAPLLVKGLRVLVIPLKHCPLGAFVANLNSTSISAGIPEKVD